MPLHSAQLGDVLMAEVISLLRDLRFRLDAVSSRMISWRLEGGRVKSRGSSDDIVDREIVMLRVRAGGVSYDYDQVRWSDRR